MYYFELKEANKANKFWQNNKLNDGVKLIFIQNYFTEFTDRYVIKIQEI